jgi:NitT/TauT family transport system substrate-binding protein
MMTTDDDLKLVNLLQTTQHSTLVLISRTKNVRDFADLAGCRIGTWKVGFSEIPHMIDEEQHLDIEWVKLINSLNLYIAGAIDATLAKSYNELILFSMSGITPGSVLYFSEHGYDFPEDGLYVSEAFYKKNPEKCRLFAEASKKGWDWVRDNREDALDIVMKYVKESNVPTNRYNQKWMLDAILEAHEDVKGGVPSYRLDEDAFNRLNEALVKYGYIARPVVYERFTGGTR